MRGEKATDIAVIGFPLQRAELLIAALKSTTESALTFRLLQEPINRVNPDLIADSVVFLYADDASGHDTIIKAAQEFRAKELYYNPIFAFMRTPPHLTNSERDWAIYFQPLPPDIDALASILSEATPVSGTRRRELVMYLVGDLAESISTYMHSFEANAVIEIGRIKTCIEDALFELESSKTESVYTKLYDDLKRLAAEPGLQNRDLEKTVELVIDAENTEREKDKSNRLLSKLHDLNNVLRLATWKPDNPSATIERIIKAIASIQKRGNLEPPPRVGNSLSELLDDVSVFLQSEDGQKEEVADPHLLKRTLTKLYEFSRSQEISEQSTTSVGRVVIVEDDPDWRRQTSNVVASMLESGCVEVQTAGTVAQAQMLLRGHEPALALVDLGLPFEEGGEIVTDAGLALIKQFSASDKQGHRYQHRFVITTAAENYAEAVREALSLGVSPASYLQKRPRTWEQELRAQVRLALQPPPMRPPTIEVFKRTGRVVRIEGLEITLDYPQWCLLSALAESRRGIWNEPEKLAHVLYWNYSLNPESRNPKHDDLDPRERLLLQLPHYASELRQELADAYLQVTNRPVPLEVVSFDEDAGYRLNAQAVVLDHVDEHFQRSHRPSVLIVEDSPEWGERIVQELRYRGFATRLARWTDEARQSIGNEVPDLISLDLELPATNAEWLRGDADASRAVELIDHLRRNFGQIPVTILTAIPWRDQVMLEVLRKGVRVDDYLSKHWEDPISRLANSLARLWQETVTRTRILDWNASAPLYPIMIDSVEGILTSVSGCTMTFSGKGKDILKVLSATPNVFVSRSELIEAVYGDDVDNEDWPEDPDKALNQHIKRLRKTITDSTEGVIPGDEIVRGDRGIYWLRGMVQ